MKDKLLNSKTIEKILFFCMVAAAGIYFLIFYGKINAELFDIKYHKWFAELLFDTDLDTMSEISYLIPTHAITYPLFHICLKMVALLTGGDYYMACSIIFAAANMLSIVLYKILFTRIYKPSKIYELAAIDVFSVASIIFMVFRSALTKWRYYDVQCAANPVHNPTILFVRPIGIVAFLFFVSYLEKYNDKNVLNKNLLGFAAFSLLSIVAKPNYAIVFLPAMGVVTLITMIYRKSLKVGFALLGAVLPSIMLLIWQFMYLSGKGIGGKMEFSQGGFQGLGEKQILMVSIATFPVVLILFSLKAFRENIYYQVSLFALGIGWLQMFYMTNGPSGDFSWGYDISVQFATVTSLAIAMKYKENRIRRYIAYAAFAWQTICGIQYILLVYDNFKCFI